MRRPTVFASVGAATFLAVVPATTAVAAETSLESCQVQVNYPHQSTHNPDNWNVEFRAYNCAKASTVDVSRKVRAFESRPDGSITGGGDFAWKYKDTLNVPATPGSASTFYNEPCNLGSRYTITVQGLFTINGRSTELTESNSFTCR